MNDIPRRFGACDRMHARQPSLQGSPGEVSLGFLCGNGRRVVVLVMTAALLVAGFSLSCRWYQGMSIVDQRPMVVDREEGIMENDDTIKASPDGANGTSREEGKASRGRRGWYSYTKIKGLLVIKDCFGWLSCVLKPNAFDIEVRGQEIRGGGTENDLIPAPCLQHATHISVLKNATSFNVVFGDHAPFPCVFDACLYLYF